MLRSLFLLAVFTSCAVAQYATPTPGAPTASPPPPLSHSSATVDGLYIALTFDDGPAKNTTPRLLDMLAKRKIKATFFVLGENVEKNPDILKRIIANGHEVGNHSWSHLNFAQKPSVVRDQLQRTQDIIFQIAGIKPKVMRPPYGAITEHQKKWVTDQFGLKVILWEVDPLDWKKPGASVIARRILAETRPGAIILVHDIHAQTIDAMPEALDGLLAKGYKFVTVSELLAMDNPAPKPTPAAEIP